MNKYKLGLIAPRAGSVPLKFAAALNAASLPVPPQTFGRSGLVKNYGMLDNDTLGDCVPAGTDHLIMLRNAVQNVTVNFTDANTVADYSAMTGYSPYVPFSDQGTDMQAAAAYWQNTGMIDSAGARHKIDAYVDIQIGNIDEVVLSSYLFVGTGIGVNLPTSAEAQFDANEPWSIVANDSIDGGHFFPIIDRTASGNLVAVTWGREQELTVAWLQKYMNFGIGYLSKDILNDITQLSPDAYNYDMLDQYLKEV
jgi:hypothetical protein